MKPLDAATLEAWADDIRWAISGLPGSKYALERVEREIRAHATNAVSVAIERAAVRAGELDCWKEETVSEEEKTDPSRYAPDGAIWVCGACGKTSKPDRYGLTGSYSPMWDESCMLNAVLCKDDKPEGVKGIDHQWTAWEAPN